MSAGREGGEVWFMYVRKILAALILFAGLCTFSACGGQPEKKQESASREGGFPVTVRDALNREVKVARAPERIVSLSPGNTEILFALGLEDRVAGVTNYCDYPEQAKAKPKIGGFDNPSVELILDARPDLVIANTMHENIIKQLEGAGVPVLTVDAADVTGILGNIETIGKATGSSARAGDVISAMKQRIQEVSEKVAKLPEEARPRVYFEIWPDPLTTCGEGSFLDSLIKTAGGINVAGDVNKRWVVYSPEVLLAKDPQVIIYTHHFTSGQSLEDFKSRKGWQGISAVKNNRIYQLPDENLVFRPGPRIVNGLEIIAGMLHPELFKK